MSLLRAGMLNWRQRKLRQLGRNIGEPAIAALYNKMHFRYSAPFIETQFLAVDLEMTGLDAKKDQIVSIGFVPVINGSIGLGEARHLLVASGKGVGDSATIHHIRDQDLHQAQSLSSALRELFKAMEGRVLLLHHAPLDLAFLNSACQRLFNAAIRVPVVDTLQLERRRLNHRQTPIKDGELRLFNCRRRYNLPDMRNHNALSDALATAELFLAIAAHKGEASNITLAEIISS